MKSILLIIVIFGASLSIGCVYRCPIIQDGQIGSFYLRSIETGRLYGPFSGEENPPGGADFKVLLTPRVRDTLNYKDVSIGRILWAEDFGEQTLLPDELHPIERELAEDNSFLKRVFTSEAGTLLTIGDEENITHAWAVYRLDSEEAVLVRFDYKYKQTHVGLNQLKVHRALTDRRIEAIDLYKATVHEMVEQLESQAAEALGNTGITFSVEGDESDWSQVHPFLLSLRDFRVIDLLEVLRDAYGILFRIDGNLIRLYSRE